MPDTVLSSQVTPPSKLICAFSSAANVAALAADEKAQISLDGGVTWLDSTVSGTTWSYDNQAATLADGTYNVQVRVIDTAGNVGQTASQSVTVDGVVSTAAIAITSITTDSGASATDYITNDNTLVFNGTLGAALAADEKAQISLDGGVTWLDSTVSGTTWSYDNQAATLADGTYNVQVRVIDTAGNVGQTASQSVTVDGVVSTAAIAITSITTDSGASATDYITSDNTLVFNGTLGAALAADEKAQISLDGGATWLDSTVSGTTWSYDNQAATLADGTYNVQVRVIDTAGNVGQTASQSVVIDGVVSTAAIAITSITTDSGASATDYITSDNTLVFNGTLGAALAADEKAQISLDGGATWLDSTVSGTTWSYDNQAATLADGTYNVQVRVIDTAGNVGQTASQSVVIDGVVSTAAIAITSITTDSGASATDYITSDNTLVFNGTLGAALAADEKAQISLDGGATWLDSTVSGTTWSYDNQAATLADGTYNVQVRVIDTAGNVGQTASQSVVIDGVVSTAAIAITSITTDSGASATDYITSDNTLVFNGTLGAALAADEKAQISLDGGATWLDSTVSGTTWSYDNQAATLADGTYNVQVRVIDTAGNVGQTASQSVVIDGVVSTAAIAITSITTDSGASATDYITSDNTLVFNGTLGAALAADEKAQISLDGGATWLDSTVSGTTWSYDNQAATLADGTYNVQVRVIDTAGNVGQTASQSVG
ncbi:hypothetical protein CER19_27805 [Pseudomonas sp. GL93]|uniref:Ig-like domain-containing protein n=1 Tax=Pseudomonas sp. GL93 TaxID=2014741 RepID=UPI000E31C3E5|nr:Ig-like domain-containing protein [Pseudomonas sp. GL93]RFD23936.1 hypothetical protein CER19_27805 [Pseudomonas sp. GL93]